MKIIVKSEEQNLHIWFPTGMLCNRLTAGIGEWAIQKWVPRETFPMPLKKGDLQLIVKTLNQVRRRHRNLQLVDVEESGGTRVQIYL